MFSQEFFFSVVLNSLDLTSGSFAPWGAAGWACRIASVPTAPAAASAAVLVAALTNSRRLTVDLPFGDVRATDIYRVPN